ncbi:unnamed protein product [Rotaria magnacalcarata]|uniref:Uncharacterized protein n=1 Tax=Rotaria magnacalcarata TaxID=392030 RepID=A0A816Z5U3_9BILA|nr:unnamed protein product [Rotaria magnacalcarata]CAF1629753.1 unnamed protein product [Rotaria magnacalcarata]CAF2081044.1 unnamed protein product [Rotaria magnacalcarata]CAF2098944.1 unnamed protein product [Rotaria magnacalcarata]CAF2178397.1 unnamed protein product [Rotaria magnacalcarata]
MAESNFQNALSKAVPINGWLKRLLPHERELYESGQLQNITHHGSSSIWLEAPSSLPQPEKTLVYRPMGDTEVIYLVEHGELPATQSYQAIIEDENGRLYSNKYLTGPKYVATHPTTIVEFCAPTELIEALKKIQMKVEDGALSMGLGHKAGKGLPLFNESMRKGDTTFRIVKIKRSKDKQKQ